MAAGPTLTQTAPYEVLNASDTPLPRIETTPEGYIWKLSRATLKISSSARITDWWLGSPYYREAFMSQDYEPRDASVQLPREAVGVRFGFAGKEQDRFTVESVEMMDENRRIVFELVDDQVDSMTRGLKIRHVLISTGEYRIRWETILTNPTEETMPLHPSSDPNRMLGLIFGLHQSTSYWTSLATGTSDDMQDFTPEDRFSWPSDAPGAPGTHWQFAAWRSNHFVVALRTDDARPLLAGRWPIQRQTQSPQPQDLTAFVAGLGEDQLAAGDSLKLGFDIYLGEKREETMAQTPFSPLFDRYGAILGVFERPLFLILKFFYSLTLNWGVAIFLLTLSVKLLLLPLNIKQNRSMAAMQAIQPELKKLQDKYSEDRQKLSQEMMKLYQKHQINPIAGCLPMLLQMPIFISLYYTVSSSVEMYGVPFLWIPNLAYEDPYLILPITFTLSFLITQRKMTVDPSQKAIMMFMPFMMFFMMMHLPAGVMLYIVGQSIFSNLEQAVIRKPTPAQAEEKKPDSAKKR